MPDNAEAVHPNEDDIIMIDTDSDESLASSSRGADTVGRIQPHPYLNRPSARVDHPTHQIDHQLIEENRPWDLVGNSGRNHMIPSEFRHIPENNMKPHDSDQNQNLVLGQTVPTGTVLVL